ncbi:MAG: LPXTG cell wall anchor domain-containing protein [Acidimicrobiales bacterium]
MKKALSAAMLMMAAGTVSVASLGGTASAAETCVSETYSWTNTSFTNLATWNPSINTGLTVAAPGAGQRLVVTSATWTAYDRILGEDPAVTRDNPEENNEYFATYIGGVKLGGSSSDLPDTAAEGAPSPWFSGVVAGDFAAGGTVVPGGAITVQFTGGSELPNALTPKVVTVVLDRCTEVVPTTTAPAPTTSVASGAPTTTTVTAVSPTTTVVAAAAPTTVASSGALPATGGDMTLPLILAGLAAGTGAALLMVRRKAGSH